MADIQLKCAQCGKETAVSEFVSVEALTCPACGAALCMPERKEEAAPLKIRLQERESKTGLTGREMDVDVLARAVAAKETDSVLGEVHKARTQVRKSTGLWLWVILLLVGGGLVGWQHAVAEGLGPEWLADGYPVVRSVVSGLAMVTVLVVAFYESWVQGVLCLLLPFYILYYSIVRMEFNLVRGLFLGVCVALAAEVKILPKQSLLIAAQGGFEQMIVNVNQLIQRAGEPPNMPPSRKRGRSKPKSFMPLPPRGGPSVPIVGRAFMLGHQAS
ncbi:MAG: hypothetical protein KA248_04045 [Kiritimatiellae bacterium]|nr:hypothetical protein [Kiritimatiellia bacterium]